MHISPRYSFRFESSYAGRVHYRVTGDGDPYTIELVNEHALDDYWRKNYNGTEEQWNLGVVALVGTIHRTDLAHPLTQAVVDAFNEWRRSDAERRIALIKGDPDKYGPWDDANVPEWLQVPAPKRAVHYVYDRCPSCRDWRSATIHCTACWSGWACTIWPPAPASTQQSIKQLETA